VRKKINKIVEKIYISAAGAKGVSIGKTDDGKVVMVKNAVVGDVVDIEVYKSKKRFAEGKAIHFHSYSPFRVEPKCKHFGVCGGCKWQNLSYEKQLEIKQEEVFGNIKKIAGITDFTEVPIFPSQSQYNYRNKMEFSFSANRWLTEDEIKNGTEIPNKNALGFHIPGMWSKVLDLDECFLQQEPSNAIRLEIKKFAIENAISFFNLVEQNGELRTLMLRCNSQNEWMLLLQFYEDHPVNRNKILQHIQKKFPEIKSLLFAINPKPNDSVYDLEIQKFAGDDYLIEKIQDLEFKIGAKSFFQTNYEQAIELYRITKEFAAIQEDEIVYDLYTGTGTIAQYIAKNAKKVIGIESVQEAIDAAKEHSTINKIDNVSFFCGDMKDIFTQDFITENGNADVVITDPPRDGMHKNVVDTILKLSPNRIVYVSCNSATQARDIEILKQKYNLIKVQAVDMFPQTFHVESVALLEIIPNRLIK